MERTKRLTYSKLWRGTWMSLVAVVLASAAITAARADFEVAAGWDLWVTDPMETTFEEIPFQGVPLETFDFDGNVQEVEDTDTIVRRLEPAMVMTGGETATIDIELVALQLRSVAPIDLGGLGLDFYYVTLSETMSATGTMDITFDDDMKGGTYNSEFQVPFDLRKGGLNQPIIPGLSNTLTLTLPDEPWRRTAPPAVLKIDGVNHRLKPDMSQDQDFWAGHPKKDEHVYYTPPPCQPHGEMDVRPTIHCITSTREPPKPLKWEQRPFDEQNPTLFMGENIPSDLDWRQVMDPNPPAPVAPNWTVADDFQSDGRPIVGVRWWGSYFDALNQPLDNGAVIEDGFIISFFSDIPDPNGDGSIPGELLGTYVAPIPAVEVKPTEMAGWDKHPIWEYQVHLENTHADHLMPGLSEEDRFLERAGETYWISIAAENGHVFDDETWTFIDEGDPVEPDHFWGWHTSLDSFDDVAVMGDLTMPDSDWVYGNWEPIEPNHAGFDMAFALKAGEIEKTKLGDFNDDGFWNCLDIDALTAAIAVGSTDLSFDMNGDGEINLDDVTEAGVGWLAVGGQQNPDNTGGGNPFLPGDANLDGTVDGSDFLIWNGSKFAPTDAWCEGDFDANGFVDGSDFLTWNTFKFQSSDAVHAVPEPASGVWLLASLLVAGLIRRR